MMVGDIMGELLCHVDIPLLQIHLQSRQRPRQTGVIVSQRHDGIRILIERSVTHFHCPEVAQLVGDPLRFRVLNDSKPVRCSAAIDVIGLSNALGIKGLHPLTKGEGQVIRQIGVGNGIKQRCTGSDLSPHFRFMLRGIQQPFIATFDPGAIQLPTEIFHVFGASIGDQRRRDLFTSEIEQMNFRTVPRRAIRWKNQRQVLPVEIGHLGDAPGILP